ncbi:PREDICTED: uncharacterized protein LOC109355707 [Lupinus angustifolius]|uniref:uncharacterized protein LOC109355707 n=1 Tax=Lupinus angustifolius TaxID=3871 RepID=UPI00092EAA22|nr:PREDICTED: uncharacterized protein LOC109355707 [Lupinus angustifolius]
MFILAQKLKNLNQVLKAWNIDIFDNIHLNVKIAMVVVESNQNANHQEDLREQEDEAQRIMLHALNVEELFWKEKARCDWYTYGDRNTSFFHKTTKIRQDSKGINFLNVGDTILTSKQDIDNHVLHYFEEFFATENVTSLSPLINTVIPSSMTELENYMLTNPPSMEEVKGVVFAMKGDGAPGPDGFSGCFYQTYWDIVGEDVYNLVMQFFNRGWILPNLNASNLVLIPKFLGANKVEDYRPIALANFQFKIITKVLADRLAMIASRIVSPQQRGVRQVDPLSPILFCIVEDVLSRGIAKLVEEGKLNTISGPSILCLNHLLLIMLQFLLPFKYLGAPLFKGKPIKLHLQPIADRIANKLANWKGACLSIIGRVELVKYVIHSMLSYTFHFYAWPIQLIKALDKRIRNFIWAGDSDVSKLCTVKWMTICTPTSEGGLGLRSVSLMNKVGLLKLAWRMLSSNQEWACFYRQRFSAHFNPSTRFLKSSIWQGIKQHWYLVQNNSIYLIGDGKNTNFWKDNWLGMPLVDSLHIPKECHSTLHAKVADFIDGNTWIIPSIILSFYPEISNQLTKTIKTNSKDNFIWQPSADGNLSLKQAYKHCSPTANSLNCFKLLWNKSIPPFHHLALDSQKTPNR